MKQGSTTYLDHAAGTFLLPEVADLVRDFSESALANPSSIHARGRAANMLLDQARRSISSNLGTRPGEILFTSGGTEANNLALKGLAQAGRGRGNHIISCGTEHPSVVESLKSLEQSGYEVSILPLDRFGQLDLSEVEAAIRPTTILISFMWVNNETGLIHPVEALGELARTRGIPFHSDAVQAVGHLPIDLSELPIDALSISGHKLGAPAGIGVLYLRKGTALAVQSHGGSQENSLRGGTQNLLGALAMAKAMKIQCESLDSHSAHFNKLSKLLLKKLGSMPHVHINRTEAEYSPHIVNCSVGHVDGEAMFIRLDLDQVAVSNGSACTSGSQAPSHVLTALGFDKARAQASIRISLGLTTTPQEIELFSEKLEQIIRSIEREP